MAHLVGSFGRLIWQKVLLAVFMSIGALVLGNLLLDFSASEVENYEAPDVHRGIFVEVCYGQNNAWLLVTGTMEFYGLMVINGE